MPRNDPRRQYQLRTETRRFSLTMAATQTQPLDDSHVANSLSPEEFNDIEYFTEVLRLQLGGTEDAVDVALAQQASVLGIKIESAADLQNGHSSLCESDSTIVSARTRTRSSGSLGSLSTDLTSPRSSDDNTSNRSNVLKDGVRRSTSFTEYDRFLAQANPPTAIEPPAPRNSTSSSLSLATKRSMINLRNGIRGRFSVLKARVPKHNNSCVSCLADFEKGETLRTLPCSHKYCDKCLRDLVQQALSEESKMPPKCCGPALSASIIKSILSHDEQHAFMKKILEFSTPWEQRIFCPNAACGEFMPKQHKIDPKRPFQIVCQECRTRVCSLCNGNAHMTGQDCSSDWGLDTVLRMGKDRGWRRCYKCWSLVELTPGCSHITCRCEAEFCYVCCAVWDPTNGCPNYCSSEEESELCRVEEGTRISSEATDKAEREVAMATLANEALEAQKRMEESQDFRELRERQTSERDRFCAFEERMKWHMWDRLGQTKVDLLSRYTELEEEMKERHSRDAILLEDRQVNAEMDLRAKQNQNERVVHGRLRHMEAYCHGLGQFSGPGSEGSVRSSSGSERPRVVTERDLQELGFQYNIRGDMDRLHQSRINVLREKQSKRMEKLLDTQQNEEEKLGQDKQTAIERLDKAFTAEAEEFNALFQQRKERLERRWRLSAEISRKGLESKHGAPFASLPDLDWPEPSRRPEALSVVLG